MSNDEKKLTEIINRDYRKDDEPINIARLIEIVEKLDRLEEQDDRDIQRRQQYAN